MDGILTLLWLLLLPLLTLLTGIDDSEFQNSIPAETMWAVEGKDAELPCDVTPEDGDVLNMVLWFRGTSGIPLYSLDARNGSMVHWAMGSDLGSRSYLAVGPSGPARLRITRVVMDDEGIYRCRVDFLNSPTRNFKFNLTLVVMPSEPMVFDHQGREVIGVAGPYLQGYDLFLSCHVVGGRPRPLVTWWRDTLLLDDSMDSVTPNLSVNHLTRPNVSRALFNARFQCRVVLSPLLPPLSKEVIIDVYLKPEGVRVRSLGAIRSAGRPQQFECETWGSVPPARISWYLDGEPVRYATFSTEEGTNSTVGVMTYKPSAEDDGREVTCRAENPRFPGSLIDTSMPITVHYVPTVVVRTDTGVDVQALREGDQLTMVCKVHAKPQATHISWFHGEMYLGDNLTSRLQLTNLTSQHSGEYSCAARNSEGDSRSSPVSIRIQFSPFCSKAYAVRTVAALRHETIRIRCEVEADPGVVKFRWTFNSSSEVLPVPPSRVLVLNASQPTSFLDFTPVSEEDFGTLACWASNSIGNQMEPCVTHIIPARIPEPPADCVVRNHSTGGVEVSCSPSDSGGLQQHFLLEAIESSQSFQLNGTSSYPYFPVAAFKVLGSEPSFLLQGLEAGRPYLLRIHAVNAKGQSDPPVVIPYFQPDNTSTDLQTYGSRGAERGNDQKTSIFVILGSLISIAVLLVCVFALTTSLLACRRKAAAHKPQPKYENTLHETHEPLTRREDAFVIKIPLPKVHNSCRDGCDKDCQHAAEMPAVETVVLRRTRGSLSRDARSSTFRQSSGEQRRSSAAYKAVCVDDTGDGRVASRNIEAGSRDASRDVKCKQLLREQSCDSGVKSGSSTCEKSTVARTSFIEDAARRNHPRVTLDPHGQILRCVLPPDKEDELPNGSRAPVSTTNDGKTDSEMLPTAADASRT